MSGILFTAAFGFYAVGLFHSAAGFLTWRNLFFKVAFISVLIGFGFHTVFLVAKGIELSFYPPTGMKLSLAFFAWTVVLCFLIAYFRYRIQALGLFLLPLVAAMMLSTVFVKESAIPDILRSSWVYIHSTCMFLAYGMFFVTFIASVLYLLQVRELKSKKPKTFFYELPSLVVLDDLFFKFLTAGFTFMTAGMLFGVVWAEQQWVTGWYRDPKVIAAGTTWVIYLILIYLRASAGWRGKRVAWMSLCGFVSVLFTYLGARLLGGQHIFLQ